MTADPIFPLVFAQDLRGGLTLFFALAIGHAVADYPLQGSFLSKAKSRHSDLRDFFGNSKPPAGLWIQAMSAHSLIHAGAVWLITGSVLCAAMEAVFHFIIDFEKCEGRTSFHTDQALHYGCKLLYTVLLVIGWGPLG